MARRSTHSRRRYAWFVVVCVIAGVWLRLPAVDAGLLADDWDHYAMQQGIYPIALPPFDLFNFVPDRDVSRRALLESGRLPWYASPQLHLAAFRPLASALVYADFAWFDGHHHPARLHWHSIGWWLVLIVGIAVLLLEVMPPPAAAIAVAFCVVDDAYLWPVSWVANRSQLQAIAFVIWGLYALVRAQHAPRWRWVAVGLGALGFACGEHALAPLSYVAAFELFGASAVSTRQRWWRLVPWILLVLTYGVLRHGLGYGIAGSSFYIDPLSDPRRYLDASSERIPQLLGELWFGIPAEWRDRWPPWQTPLAVKGLLALGLVEPADLIRIHVALGLLGAIASLAIVSVLVARRHDPEQRTVRWLFYGALGCLIPLCGTESMSRLTVAPGIGFSALFGLFCWKLGQLGMAERKSIRPWRCLLAVLAIMTLLYLHAAQAGMRSHSEALAFSLAWPSEHARLREARLQDQHVAGRHLLIITSDAFAVQFSLPYMMHFDGLPLPLSSEILTPAFMNAHELVRAGPNVLDIRFPDPLIGKPFEHSVYRSENGGFERGQRFHGPRFDVTVLGIASGQPTHLRFTFPHHLNDPRYLFMASRKGLLRPLTLPRVDDMVRVPASSDR